MVTARKKIGIIIVVVFVMGIVVLFGLRIGPGLPPPDGLPYMLIPTDPPGFNTFASYQLPQGVHRPAFPGLRVLSPYSAAGYFAKPGHDELIVVKVWYFEDYRNFTEMQGELRKYLEMTGNNDTRQLNLTMQRSVWNSTCERIVNATLRDQCYGPALHPLQQFRVNVFSDNTTAGYFFVSERPIISYRDDYFILYYGIFNSTHPTENLETLNELMEAHNTGPFTGNPHEIQENTPAGGWWNL